MTEISQLLAKINTYPTSLVRMDWNVETCSFSKERMRQLIDGIIDDEVCQLVGEFIIDAWYDACEVDDSFDEALLKEITGFDEMYGMNIYEYRFYSERGGKATEL